jgi:hypothetical protein
MGEIEQILQFYTRMRGQGMEVRPTLDVLKDMIDGLSDTEQLELARRIRAQEAGETAPLNPAPPAPIHRIRLPEEDEDETDGDWVICANCGKANRQEEALCFACGHLLAPSKFETQRLKIDDTLAKDDYFGADSVLVLVARNSQKTYEIRPQKQDREWILGRSTRHSPMNPDIDLADSDGNRLGVSRLHLSVRYDSEYKTITVFDLGSANGSYVNGQRLHPHEVRVLRHNDELRLGNLLLTVAFKHHQ